MNVIKRYRLWDIPHWFICLLCLLLLKTVDGLSVYPGPVVSTLEGAASKLTCYLSDDELQLSATTPSRCTLSWYRVIASRRDHVTRSQLSESEDPDISMSLWRGHDGVPREAVVSITEMKKGLQGKYFCSLVCSDHVLASESVSVILETDDLWQWQDRGTIIASIICFVFIACLLIGAMVVALKDSCCSRRHSSSHISASCSDILAERSTDSGLFDDLPPRYSLVVVTDEEGNPRTELQCKKGVNQSVSSNSLVCFSLPPPNYQEALKILRSNGVHMKQNDLHTLQSAHYTEALRSVTIPSV